MTVFQEIKAVTAGLNTQFKGFNMEHQQLGDTPMPYFLKTSVQRIMSKEDITEVIGMPTELLENVNLEINKLKTERKDRFESIESHTMNLLKDREDFKEWNSKSKDNNERRIIQKENHELKKKILELESSFQEKEQVINSIIESFTYQQQPQPVKRNRWYTEKKKKQHRHKNQSKIIFLVTIVLMLSV